MSTFFALNPANFATLIQGVFLEDWKVLYDSYFFGGDATLTIGPDEQVISSFQEREVFRRPGTGGLRVHAIGLL